MAVRTRFAPSPTGLLHLGNVRAAAFNWLFARRHGGQFILRIEDTDVERNVEGSEEGILEDIRWLGLDWDEGPLVGGAHAPYRQSGRDPIYQAAVERLVDSGRAYPCFCGEEEPAEEGEGAEGGAGRSPRRYGGHCRRLEPEERRRRLDAGEPHAIRFALPDGEAEVSVHDEVFGTITVPIEDLDDFVLRRTDGRVTYNFGVVVDDLDMRITHVIRGVGHLSNTPKQALLFDALGRERPVFAHLPTVLAPEGGKLSKRAGATPVAELRAQGYPPEAVLNYLSLLGWSHPEEREVLTREELVHSISLERVGRSDTRLDPDKLRWISAQHLAAEEPAALAAHVQPFVDRERFPGALEGLEGAVGAIRTRLTTYADVNEHLALLFPPEGAELEAARRAAAEAPEARGLLDTARQRLGEAPAWSAEALEALVRSMGQELGLKGAGLFHPLRKALIGSEKGPELGRILAGIGRAEALRRIDQALGS